MPASLSATFVLSQTAVFRDLDGEAVILDLESGTYFGLNRVGTRVWQLLARDGRLSAVHGELSREFEVDAAQLERDLLTLVDRLQEAGLGSLQT